MLKVPSEPTAKSVYGIPCKDNSVSGAAKLVMGGGVVSLTGIVGGTFCLGFEFFPPVAIMSILAISTIGLVACLAVVISRFGRVSIPDLAQQSSAETSPTLSPAPDPSAPESVIPSSPVRFSVEKLPEIDLVGGEKPSKRLKFSFRFLDNRFCVFSRGSSGSVEAQGCNDDAAFLEKVKEKFPDVVPEFGANLYSVEDLKKLLECEKLHPHITSIVISPEFNIGNDAAARLFTQAISSFRALKAINICGCGADTNGHAILPGCDDYIGGIRGVPISICGKDVGGGENMHAREAVTAAILPTIRSNTLKKVTLQMIHNIALEEINSSVNSISLKGCTAIDAKSALESRRWKKITLVHLLHCPIFSPNAPKGIITEKLETSTRAIYENPALLECFDDMSKLVLYANASELELRSLAPLLGYEHLREIVLINKSGTRAPAALLETIEKLPLLKKLTVLTPLSEYNRRLPESIISEEEKRVLLDANHNLRIVVKTTQ